MSTQKAPPTKALGTGHLHQWADCKQHWLQGAKHTESRAAARPGSSWAAFLWSPPPLSRLQSLCQDQTPAWPQEPQWGEQPLTRSGSCLSSAFSLSNGLFLGKRSGGAAPRQGRKAGANTCRCCCSSRDVSTSERDLLVSPLGLEGKQRLRLKISSGDSCAFYIAIAHKFQPHGCELLSWCR